MAFPWGVWFEPVQPVARIVELARLAEREGAEVCFLADEGTDRDLYVALTAVALGTERMIVAPAITNPFSRHPVTTAAAIATLAELVPGRVWHGLGVGGSRVLAPLGLVPERPYTALRDAFEAQPHPARGRRGRCRPAAVGEGAGADRDRRARPSGAGARRRGSRLDRAVRRGTGVAPERGSPTPRERLQGRVVRVPRVRARATAARARPLLLHGARRAARDPRARRPHRRARRRDPRRDAGRTPRRGRGAPPRRVGRRVRDRRHAR